MPARPRSGGTAACTGSGHCSFFSPFAGLARSANCSSSAQSIPIDNSMGTRFAERVAQEADLAPGGAASGYVARAPRVVLRLPDLTNSPAAGLHGGHAASAQGELPPEIALPPLDEGAPWPDALHGEPEAIEGAGAYERSFHGTVISGGGRPELDGRQPSSTKCEVQPTMPSAARPLTTPPKSVATPVPVSTTDPTSPAASRECTPQAAQALSPTILAARRSLRRFEAELHRARKLAHKVASRLSMVPWKRVFSLAAWLGLLQQPRMWLAATAAAAAQIVLAMVFLGGAPSREFGSVGVSPARSARPVSPSENGGGGRASGLARAGVSHTQSHTAGRLDAGLTQTDAVPGEPETGPDSGSIQQTGPTLGWDDNKVPRTASRLPAQPGIVGTQRAEFAPNSQTDPVRRPGSVQLRGIIQEWNEEKAVP